MRAKMYITGIPSYLTAQKLRLLLDDYHLHYLNFIHTVHGNIGVVELNSLEDAQMLTATLSRFTLEDGCKLTAVPAGSSEGQKLEQLANHIAETQILGSKNHAAA